MSLTEKNHFRSRFTKQNDIWDASIFQGATLLGEFLLSLKDIGAAVSLKVSELKKSCPTLKLGAVEATVISCKNYKKKMLSEKNRILIGQLERMS